MARTIQLECPKCGFQPKTSGDVAAEKAIGCPRCRSLMESTRPASAIEEENTPNFTDDLEPILSTRSARMKMGQKRHLVSNRPPPFHQSRSFIAAVCVAAVALVVLVLFSLYRDKIDELGRGMKDIRKSRENSVQNSLSPKAGKAKGGQAVAGKKKGGQGPVDAPAETQVGDLVVSVTTASLAKIDGQGGTQCLLLKLRITNTSQMPITFVSRSQPQIPVELRVADGKEYKRLGPLEPVETVIDPKRLFLDSVAFEEPPTGVELDLKIPFPGGDRPVHFRLPSKFIKRTMDVVRLGSLAQ